MAQSARAFSQRLNHCLDETGVPNSIRERAAILSKMIDIPRQLSFSILEGHQIPEKDMLEKIANEFEVDQAWLSGEK